MFQLPRQCPFFSWIHITSILLQVSTGPNVLKTNTQKTLQSLYLSFFAYVFSCRILTLFCHVRVGAAILSLFAQDFLSCSCSLIFLAIKKQLMLLHITFVLYYFYVLSWTHLFVDQVVTSQEKDKKELAEKCTSSMQNKVNNRATWKCKRFVKFKR